MKKVEKNNHKKIFDKLLLFVLDRNRAFLSFFCFVPVNEGIQTPSIKTMDNNFASPCKTNQSNNKKQSQVA